MNKNDGIVCNSKSKHTDGEKMNFKSAKDGIGQKFWLKTTSKETKAYEEWTEQKS